MVPSFSFFSPPSSNIQTQHPASKHRKPDPNRSPPVFRPSLKLQPTSKPISLPKIFPKLYTSISIISCLPVYLIPHNYIPLQEKHPQYVFQNLRPENNPSSKLLKWSRRIFISPIWRLQIEHKRKIQPSPPFERPYEDVAWKCREEASAARPYKRPQTFLIV